MMFFQWYDGEETRHFTSLVAARKELRAFLSIGEETEGADFREAGTPLDLVTIERIDLGKIDRAKVLKLLSGEGYVEDEEPIETWEAVPCKRCDACKEAEERHGKGWERYARGCTSKRTSKAKAKVVT